MMEHNNNTAAGDNELEWQDVAIEQETGLLGATDQQHISIDDVDEETPKQGSSAGSQRGDQVPRTGLGAVCACFSVEYYRPYFNVDTKDVAKRMLLTFYPPQTPSFSEMTAENPDLYGPIWIAATLVFLLGAMSNFAKWASFKPEDSTSIWKYDFTLVTLATVFIFSFMAVMGLLSWAFLRYIGVRLAAGLVRLLGLWGYALLPYFVPTLLCTIPSAALHWTTIAIASSIASYFMVYNFAPVVREEVEKFTSRENGIRSAKIMAVCVVLIQIGLGLCLKMVFFSHV